MSAPTFPALNTCEVGDYNCSNDNYNRIATYIRDLMDWFVVTEGDNIAGMLNGIRTSILQTIIDDIDVTEQQLRNAIKTNFDQLIYLRGTITGLADRLDSRMSSIELLINNEMRDISMTLDSQFDFMWDIMHTMRADMLVAFDEQLEKIDDTINYGGADVIAALDEIRETVLNRIDEGVVAVNTNVELDGTETRNLLSNVEARIISNETEIYNSLTDQLAVLKTELSESLNNITSSNVEIVEIQQTFWLTTIVEIMDWVQSLFTYSQDDYKDQYVAQARAMVDATLELNKPPGS